MKPKLLIGDAITIMRRMPDASVDAIVCDPPYDLTGRSGKGGFMGKAWDGTGVAFNPETWREALRVLKPGGHLVAAGGSRTFHRLVVAVEDAGFEIRDCITWHFGSGFPKSRNVTRDLESIPPCSCDVSDQIRSVSACRVCGGRKGDVPRGFGTALKPATEFFTVARKPLVGTVAANVLRHGTGALNIDGCRVESGDPLVRPSITRTDNAVFGKGLGAGVQTEPAGRWPANVVLDSDQAAALDAQSGTLKSGNRAAGKYAGLGYHGNESADFPAVKGDQGGASRFFFVARKDDFPCCTGGVDGEAATGTNGSSAASPGPGGGSADAPAEQLNFSSRFLYCAKAPKNERPVVDGVAHPTVKPLSLMRWLVRLVTPAGGTVLDPFAGSGTTGEAAILEGFQVTLIEREREYVPLIMARLARAQGSAS